MTVLDVQMAKDTEMLETGNANELANGKFIKRKVLLWDTRMEMLGYIT